jgi:uncharacterized protein (TIGR03437 family)
MKLQTFALLTLFYASVLAAQTAPNWTEVFSTINPPARESHAMAYDSATGQVIMFGGYGGKGQANLGDTWTWDTVLNWRQNTFLATKPSARALHAMAYDSVRGQVVLFGGVDSNGDILNDTWVYSGGTWTQKSPPVSPPGRVYHSMAFDSAHGQVVLFGGAATDSVITAPPALDDTWLWNGSTWTQASPQTSPSARYLNALAYDSAHGQVVLFGGQDVSENPLGDTWVWDGFNWMQKSPETSPPSDSGGAMAYDSTHGQAVLFGGIAGGYSSATWIWDGSNWTKESPATSPPGRYLAALAYDSTDDLVFLFGGNNGQTIFDDTWTWLGAALPAAGPSISGVVSASAFGAFSSVAPGSWVEIYGTNLAPSTQGWTGADFMGNNAPTMLGGVSVSIDGQAAFIDYISATQVNAQLPSNIATGGPLQLTVTNGTETSTAVNVTVNPTEPGLLAPTSFQINGKQYVVAQHADGTYVLPIGAIAGVASSPAKPGETIVIYGVGFGSVTPNIPAGEIATESNQLSASFEIMFGKTPAKLPYFGLAPNFVGLYQFNVTVPAVANNDLVPLTFNLGGAAGTQTLFTTVQQ